MRKQSIKLSLIDDYIKLYKILNFCKSCQESNLEIAILENECKKTIENFENVFLKLGLFDFTLKQIQQDLRTTSENYVGFTLFGKQYTLNQNTEKLKEINQNFNVKIEKLKI